MSDEKIAVCVCACVCVTYREETPGLENATEKNIRKIMAIHKKCKYINIGIE